MESFHWDMLPYWLKIYCLFAVWERFCKESWQRNHPLDFLNFKPNSFPYPKVKMVTTYEHDTKSMMDKVSRGTLPQGVVT
jgi:hypothetical protein